MPFMDGPATLAALRADPATADIPVMFLTASVMPSEVRRLQEMGAVAVLAEAVRAHDPGRPRPGGAGQGSRPPRTPRPAAADEDFEQLRAQFVRRSQAKIETAGGPPAPPAETPGDRGPCKT